MSDAATTSTTTKMPSAIEVLRTDLQRMESQFAAALPAHIPVERFMRVVMTAIQNNPDLLQCARQSLFNACVRAAQDGLLPDGREGAIVAYELRSGAIAAQWMPMVAGLRKKARNSGELSDWMAEVVHEGDEFDYQKGDNPFIFHRPAKTGGRTRPVTHAYSIAIFKDGTKSREVMTVDEIEDIRKQYSRSRKGPWSDPVAYPEMCRKTVARLHSKQLPMSTDLDTLLRRDDDLYRFDDAREQAKEIARPSAAAALDYFAASAPPAEPAKPSNAPPAMNEVRLTGTAAPPVQPPAATVAPAVPPSAVDTTHPLAAEGAPPEPAAGSVPKTPEQYRTLFDAVVAHAEATGAVAQLGPWFASDGQRRLRNACGVLGEQREDMQGIINRLVVGKSGASDAS